ncbi:MAG: hypothetical protein ACR2PW_07910 [Gammaproteobacteria bacterium]
MQSLKLYAGLPVYLAFVLQFAAGSAGAADKMDLGLWANKSPADQWVQFYRQDQVSSLQSRSEGGPVFDTGDSDADESDSDADDFNIFEYLNIQALVGFSSGSSLSREFSVLRVGGQYETGIVSLYGNFLASALTSDLDLELTSFVRNRKEQCLILPRDSASRQPVQELLWDNNNCDDNIDAADTRVYEFKAGRSEIDELYATFTFTDSLSLTTGLTKLVLGQFSFVSPVHMLLPLNSEQQIGFSKVGSRVPQFSVELNYYPIDRLQVQLAIMPETRLDAAQEELYAVSYRDDYFGGSGGGLTINPAVGYDAGADAGAVFADSEQQLIRLVYRPSWGAVGFTMYSGGFSHFIVEFLQADCDVQVYCGNSYTLTDLQDTDHTGLGHSLTSAPRLADLDAVAFEIAYTAGNWNLIAEYARFSTEADIPVDGAFHALNNCSSQASSLSDCRTQGEALNFVQILSALNGGRGYLDVTYDVIAIGAEGRSSSGSWNYSFELFNITTTLDDPNGLLDSLRAAPNSFDENWGSSLDDQFSDLFFPVFSINNSHTLLGRPANWGVGLGFFFQFGGIFSYYTVNVTDNVAVQLGFESIERVSESNTADNDNEQYDLANQMSTGLSLAVEVRF